MNDVNIKDEVLKSISRDKEDNLAYLSALIASGGEISLSNKDITLEFITYNSDLAYDYSKTIKELYNYSAEISIKRPEDKRYNKYFTIPLPAKISRYILEDSGIATFGENNQIKQLNFGAINLIKKSERQLSNYIKGLFLACGKVFIYEGNYIAEMVLPNSDFAEEIGATLLKKYGIQCSYRMRGEKTELIIKAGEMVANFLTLLGASVSSLELINILIRREMSNNINRQANCEAANSDKTAAAAVEQVNAIMTIKNLHKEDKLPPKLKEVAEYRLKNPNMPLAKIAENFALTKSGINHRMKKIIQIAQELTE